MCKLLNNGRIVKTMTALARRVAASLLPQKAARLGFASAEPYEGKLSSTVLRGPGPERVLGLLEIEKMENNRKVTRFFILLGLVGGIGCLVASATDRSWRPLVGFAIVLLGLGSISLFWALVFAPVLSVMGRLSSRKKDKHQHTRESEHQPGD